MAKKIIQEKSLVAIADAIRGKPGKSDKLTIDQMVSDIEGIQSGGGGDIEVEPIVLTGDCSYSCAGDISSNYIKMYGDTITTNDITNATNMFLNYKLSTIPFDINFLTSYAGNTMSYMFYKCVNLTELPKFNNCCPNNMSCIFQECYRLRNLPNDIESWFDWSLIDNYTNSYGGARGSTFARCYSLRNIPINFLSHANLYGSSSTSVFYNTFNSCIALDAIQDWYIVEDGIVSAKTSNNFGSTIDYCSRLKEFTFALDNGKPKTVRWKNQTITFINYLGYFGQAGNNNTSNLLSYNSGITADKEVKDAETYEALKNDPDWFTTKVEYSRYNHDSAVNTINSLPDASAYLATAGGTNTIKFKGTSGSLTDGGAINTLTAEEIAVATAKGWTVSLV